MCQDNQKPNVSDTWNNLRQPMPLRRKIYLTVRNTMTKLRTRSACCGNHGEPGC